MADNDESTTPNDDGHRPPRMFVWDLPKTDRAKELAARASFYDLRQHSHCRYNWGGGSRVSNSAYLDERLARQSQSGGGSGEAWSERKPDTPHGLPRQVTETFTAMLLSDIARPMLTCPADTDTSAFVDAIMACSHTWASLQTARDYKGAQGSAAIVLGVEDGEPVSEPLNTAHLWVREWKPRVGWVPVEVIEQKLITVQEEGEEEGEVVATRVWRTRVWDEHSVHYYRDVPENFGDDDGDSVEIEHDYSIHHGASRCPVIWMQNTRSTESPEGTPDFKGAYEQSDRADRVRSFGTRATIANADPTLVHKEHERLRRRNPLIRKGHSAKIDVSPEGDVSLLETSGATVDMCWKTYQNLRQDILQTVSCVIVDPETAGAYRSGEAISMLTKSMEAKAGRLRIPLGDEIQQIAKLWCELGRNLGVISEEDASESEVEGGIVLPPRIVKDSENPTDDPAIKAHTAGNGQYIQVKWGAFHMPTMSQLQAMMGSLTTGNGGKPVISGRTSTEIATATLSLGNPDDEIRRIKDEREAGMSEMMGAMGGSSSMFSGLDPDGDENANSERSEFASDNASSKQRASEMSDADESSNQRGTSGPAGSADSDDS